MLTHNLEINSLLHTHTEVRNAIQQRERARDFFQPYAL